MNNQLLPDRFAALVVVVLVIVTAWGNAVAMLVVAALGLVVSLLLSRKSNTRGGVLVATVVCAIAIAIALVTLLR